MVIVGIPVGLSIILFIRFDSMCVNPMTVQQCIDFLNSLDKDKNLVFIYDGANSSDRFYSHGEYDLSDVEIMCPELAKYLNDYWSDLRIYPSYSDVPIYHSGDYCIIVG